MFDTLFKEELDAIHLHLRLVLSTYAACPLSELELFWECMEYSLFSEGKRFRPLLSMLTAKALEHPAEAVLPLAAAVELVHTYSLIHDDLPAMDNDDIRRGRPTNHKVYGEMRALLAGDALLTLAFGVLAQARSAPAARVVHMLSDAAGPRGMVGGQVLDMAAERPRLELLKEIHARKTGALIRVAVAGAAVLCGVPSDVEMRFSRFGEELGMAFQLADDLQDYNPAHPEKVSFVTTLGPEATRAHLAQASARALAELESLPPSAEGLRRMIRLNQERV
ncbi:MAG: polyprenyl synthetase family protein [Bdellovibrionales bacterium]